MTHAKSILLVEDHVDSAQCLARSLVRLGHRVEVAGSISEARHLAGAQRFDLALCDLGLPDGDGCDLMRELADIYGLTGIALTGFGMPDDIDRVARAGFAAHVLKPVSLEKLVSVLEKIAPSPSDPQSPPSHADGMRS
ncbi:MAG: response regulator [Planctomycetota bacterium]|nr:response regulator [Planctomycetota bacterium]